MVVPGSIPNMMRSFANLYLKFCFFALMISIPHKAKQFSLFTIKLLVVIGAFYFIYDQIAHKPELNWENSKRFIFEKTNSIEFIVLLLLSVANRFLEILKWKNLVSSFDKINLYQSTEQVLSALTLGVFTPYGVGEYIGKTLYYGKDKAKKIVLLNLICNGIQMLMIAWFGMIGFFILGLYTWGSAMIGLFLLCLSLLFMAHYFKSKLGSITSFITSFSFISNDVHKRNMFLGFLRFITLSHQFYFLLITFDVNVPYFTLLSTISIVYLLANALPSFQLFDFAIKGSVAVYFFGQLGINEWLVVFISTLMWLLNIVIPVLLGSFFVIRYKAK
jgi:hypothetical protein